MIYINRKAFIRTTSLATAGAIIKPGIFPSSSFEHKIKAIAFDAFPIFDPRPIFKKVNELFPEKGKHIVETWQTKLFSYQWLRAAGNKYKNFWDISRDALDFAFLQASENASNDEKDLIMSGYETINVWPDVIPTLQQLKEQNLKICFLSNMTAKMLRRGIQNASANNHFDVVISTDEKQTYKPSPSAYQMGVDHLGLGKKEILFVPFAGWDMAGAKWFGYPTYWVNRLDAPSEQLDAEPDGTSNSLSSLAGFIHNYNK